jgi:hypothetical protein
MAAKDDTHAEQVQEGDTTTGIHGALLYHVSGAINAFINDLQELGLEERVITVTTSEFGRRVYSNASLGTDHGMAAPVFLFGSGLKTGVLGTNSDLYNLDNGNLIHNFDYRQIYTSLLMDWMGADYNTVQYTKFDGFVDTRLDIIRSHFGMSENQVSTGSFEILSVGPNPASDYANIRYRNNKAVPISLTVSTVTGSRVKMINLEGNPGVNDYRLNLHDMNTGYYILTFTAQNTILSRKLMVR